MSEQQWYIAKHGHQIGPMSEAEVVSNIQNGSADGKTLVFTAGMSTWAPLADVPQLATRLAAGAGPTPPIPPGRTAHEIDFVIEGTEMQYVEVELDPGESAVAEAGGMMYMTSEIAMETIFGDGSQGQQSGFMDKLMGAGKRLLTGESLFMTVFTNNGSGKQRVAFAAPYAGKILPMDLSELGGELICQKDAFLCAAKGVSIGIAFQKKIGVGLFGGEGFIMQRLEGDGLSFLHAGGTVHLVDLQAGETLRGSTPVVWWRCSPASTTTSSSSAASRRRCSAARGCSSPTSLGRAAFGCSRCRSAGWPTASTRPPHRPVAAEREKDRSSTMRSVWATSSTASRL